MDTMARFVGWLVILSVVGAFLFLIAYLVKDGIECARFVWRVRKAAGAAGDEISCLSMLETWCRYLFGSMRRPDYLVLTSNDETIYWPGREGSRRYPG